MIAIAIGLLLMPLGRPPEVLIDPRGAVVAVRLDDGRLAISPWERDGWVTEQWLQSAGQAVAAPWPADGAPEGGLACVALGCIVEGCTSAGGAIPGCSCTILPTP